ncbi:hypothetical protein L6452_14717 [Arctium lappa]|uniref:Uncharacterized protein n=1 Tax=Arctium lappa TaxID=4217 RepID=A0ACB9CLS1_ARCLA|nr:hypothetical protein L6452_14717 [Arctium lappa]
MSVCERVPFGFLFQLGLAYPSPFFFVPRVFSFSFALHHHSIGPFGNLIPASILLEEIKEKCIRRYHDDFLASFSSTREFHDGSILIVAIQ